MKLNRAFYMIIYLMFTLHILVIKKKDTEKILANNGGI